MSKLHYMPLLLAATLAYKHPHCDRARRAQFQFPDCYVPSHSDSILFQDASFLMSHDAATGYIHPGDLRGLTWPYAKNQVGSVYQQLDDGARALDLRPKLLVNSTIIFQHGSNIPVSLEQVVSEVVQWCGEKGNEDELVLLLPSNFQYEHSSSSSANLTMPSAMRTVYEKLGVTYLHCNAVYGLTMGQVKELSLLASGGYLLALDGQDYDGTFCGKTNWISDQIVTCWGNFSKTAHTKSCRASAQPLQRLFSYVLASANNPSTDDRTVLGPPSNRYEYPLNEIQALWQVDSYAAVAGLAHFSSILQDNRQSQVNQHMVELIHSGQFQNPISIFAVDNVALHGNALLSVLRTACGQSDLDTCGPQLDAPRMACIHVSTRLIVGILLSVYLLWLLVWVGVKLGNSRIMKTFLSRIHIGKEHVIERPENPEMDATLSWQPSRGLLS